MPKNLKFSYVDMQILKIKNEVNSCDSNGCLLSNLTKVLHLLQKLNTFVTMFCSNFKRFVQQI